MDSSILLMGFLPILIFLILDSLSSQKKALLGALVMALGEMLFSLIKFGGVDELTWIAFGILTLFIGMSLWKNNDIYFKIQGPFLNVVTAFIIWGALLIFDKNILLSISEKYIGLENMTHMNPHLNIQSLKKLLHVINGQLPIWLCIHAAITLWAAFKWNKWVWAAIRVLGFYLIGFVGMIIASQISL